jgi:hypothetical protein
MVGLIKRGLYTAAFLAICFGKEPITVRVGGIYLLFAFNYQAIKSLYRRTG